MGWKNLDTTGNGAYDGSRSASVDAAIAAKQAGLAAARRLYGTITEPQPGWQLELRDNAKTGNTGSPGQVGNQNPTEGGGKVVYSKRGS